MSEDWKTWWPLVQMRWRQGRRMFDARLLNERRLVIIAVLAGIWMVFDAVWLTPGFKTLQDVRKREQTAQALATALQTEVQRQVAENANQERQAHQEIRQVRARLREGQDELDRQQALLVPASQMSSLLRNLLEQNGQLRLISIRTLAPEEVALVTSPVSGSMGLPPVLYRHRIEMTVSGPYIELLRWIRAVEGMPRKLMWQALTLDVKAPSPPELRFSVHTYSPDRDALEIAP